MIVLSLLGCGADAVKSADKPVQATLVKAEPAPPQQPRVLPPLLPLSDRPDDCTLDLSGLGPSLDPEQAGRAEVHVDKRGRIVETFTWSDGTPVRVSQGGCAHIGITEEYGLAEVPDALYPTALALSGRLKRASTGMSLFDRLVRAKSLADDGSFDCGDANCRVDLHTDGPNPVLAISYDFPL